MFKIVRGRRGYVVVRQLRTTSLVVARFPRRWQAEVYLMMREAA